MQKISTYLYPNRIQLLANLASFNVEYTNVYQRIVKIYNGIDNTIEFDIKNADQKRIDLSTLTTIELTLMDAAGNELPTSPYTVETTALKGIATVTIPQDDLVDLSDQFLSYSVTAVKDGKDVMLYGDTRFGAIGTIELIGNARPKFRDARVYKDFAGEINLNGEVIKHTSAIPTKFYEAVPTTSFDFEIDIVDFRGKIYLQATRDSTISVNSFKHSEKLIEVVYPTATTITVPMSYPIGEYNYFKISWENSYRELISETNVEGLAGTVDKVTVI